MAQHLHGVHKTLGSILRMGEGSRENRALKIIKTPAWPYTKVTENENRR